MITLSAAATRDLVLVANSSQCTLLNFRLIVPDGLVLLKEGPIFLFPCARITDQSIGKVEATLGVGDGRSDRAFSIRALCGGSKLLRLLVQLSSQSILAEDVIFAQLNGGVFALL
jgi:hypothetical protein